MREAAARTVVAPILHQDGDSPMSHAPTPGADAASAMTPAQIVDEYLRILMLRTAKQEKKLKMLITVEAITTPWLTSFVLLMTKLARAKKKETKLSSVPNPDSSVCPALTAAKGPISDLI